VRGAADERLGEARERAPRALVGEVDGDDDGHPQRDAEDRQTDLPRVRGEVSRALEAARKQGRIGKGVDAIVYVPTAPEEQWLPLFEAKGEALLTTLFNVSGVRLKQRAPEGVAVSYESQDIPGLAVEVVPARALGWNKCERCWTWSPRVGEDATHPTLCERCVPVVRAMRP